ncbi:hypothetical protein C8R47DRAFT_1214635 [Mycena vitilis]|nr:hypothetical protein C8R47DRAFT_1214635 [Mycena vitilis]
MNESEERVPFHTVIENADGALVCDCHEYSQTGKPCVDLLVARMARQYGPAQNFIDLESRTERGKNAQANVPKRQPRRGQGQRFQARSDYTVDAEHEGFLAKLEAGHDPYKGDLEEEVDAPKSSEPVHPDNTDPFTAAARLSQGRPPATTPLHPGRSVTFNQKRGPKPKAHGSLLPAFKFTSDDDSLNKHPASFDVPLSHIPPQKSDASAPPVSVEKESNSEAEEPQGPVYTNEEIEMNDVDLDRWDAPEGYLVRGDEMALVVELLNALVRQMRQSNRRCFFFSDTYHSQAQDLRKVNWGDAPSAKTFPRDSMLARAVQQMKDLGGLDDCLFLHYDPARVHWLLFIGNVTTKKIFCIDPMAKHPPKSVDVQDMRLITAYFGNFGPDGAIKSKPPKARATRTYEARPAGVQQDGTSCGFWVITLALLWICGLSIARTAPEREPSIQVLRNLGVRQIKIYWKAIWTSWRIEERGLSTRPLLELMANWDMELTVEPEDGCIAPRPPWVPRFNPEEARKNITIAEEALTAYHRTQQQPPAPLIQTFAEAAAEAWGPAPDYLRECLDLTDKLEQDNLHLIIPGGKNPLTASDLRRLLNVQGQANDALMNYFQDLCTLRPDVLATDLELTPVNQTGILIVSSFLFSKLREAARAMPDEDLVQELFDLIARWYSKNLKSWWRLLAKYHDLPDPGDWEDWKFGATDRNPPTQLNAFDCGFFVMIYSFHLMQWGSINSPNAPSYIHLRGEDMAYWRVYLARIFSFAGHTEQISQTEMEPGSPVIVVENPGPVRLLGSPIDLRSPTPDSDTEIRSAFIEEMVSDAPEMPSTVAEKNGAAVEDKDEIADTEKNMVLNDEDEPMMRPSSSMPPLTPSSITRRLLVHDYDAPPRSIRSDSITRRLLVDDYDAPPRSITQSSGWGLDSLVDPDAPDGYDLVFGPTDGANNAPEYMGFAFIDKYDVDACAALCNGRVVNGVPTTYTCSMYYLVTDNSTAVNYGQGDLVVTLSRGYARKDLVIDGGFEGYQDCISFCFTQSYANWNGTSPKGGDMDAAIFFSRDYARCEAGVGATPCTPPHGPSKRS